MPSDMRSSAARSTPVGGRSCGMAPAATGLSSSSSHCFLVLLRLIVDLVEALLLRFLPAVDFLRRHHALLLQPRRAYSDRTDL